VELTTQNFDDYVSQGDWIVEFYTDWCGVCRKTTPIFERLASTLLASTSNTIHFGKINIDSSIALSARFFISGIPTFYHIKDGIATRYTPNLSMSNILDGMMHDVQSKKWEKEKPWTGFLNPFSYEAKAIYMLIGVGTMIWEKAEWVQTEYGIPSWAIVGFFFLVTLILPLALAFFTTGKGESPPTSNSNSPSTERVDKSGADGGAQKKSTKSKKDD